MGQQKISEADKRLKSYAEALIRCGNAYALEKTGDCICESVFISRQGNSVSIVRHSGTVIERGIYDMSEPVLVKRHVDRYGIEFEGVRYNGPELQLQNGRDVQAVKIGDTLHIFDMDGMGIVSIEI